tara:strand:+ start:420 stop:824 length:405 start_codon:yes stop_codon:yes gene_type:complete
MTSILKVDNIKDSADNQAISISGGNMTVAGNTTFSGTVSGVDSLGQGQSWSDVKASRAVSTTYTNSTALPIAVSVSTVTQNISRVSILVDGSIRVHNGIYTSGDGQQGAVAIVPSGSTYQVTTLGAVLYWQELR